MGSIHKNFVYNSILTVFNILFPIISFPYASRILGPQGIGRTQFIITLAQYFVVFAALGLPLYGVREVAKARNEKGKLSGLFSELIFINIISSLFVLVSYVITIFSVSKFNVHLKDYLLAGVIIAISFSNIDWFYAGLENFKLMTLRSVSIKLISFVALFLFVKNPGDTFIYLAISVFSILGNQLWNLYMLKGIVDISFSNLKLRHHLKPLFLTFGVMLGISLYSLLDTVMLGLLGNDTSVGYYSAAIKINKIGIPLITALGTVLIPRMTIAIKNDDVAALKSLFDQSFWFVCFFGMPISVGIFIFAPELISVFAGQQFEGAIVPMRIMSGLISIIGIASVLSVQILIPGSKEKYYFIAVIAGTVCSLILNFCLVRQHLATGAAIANVATELVVTIISGYFVLRYFNLKIRWRDIFVGFLTSMGFYLVALVARNISSNAVMVLGVSLPCCALFYFSVRVLIIKDRMFFSILSAIPVRSNIVNKAIGRLRDLS